jgi:hypothetical protein
MKHTEEGILKKTKKILQDLKGEFYREENIKKVVFSPDREIARGENEGKEMPCWVAVLDAPFDSSEFLTISDETGEPLYIQGKHSVYEIKKDKSGKYF